jgi:hypothetical protein
MVEEWNGGRSQSCSSCPVFPRPKIRNFHGVENGTANYEMREKREMKSGAETANYELLE